MSTVPIITDEVKVSLENQYNSEVDFSLRPDRFAEQHISFGITQAAAHGIKPGSRPVVISHNFMVDGQASQPISEPAGDHYLNFLGIGASAENEIILCLKTLPGLLDYYKRIGLLTDNAKVIELNPNLSNPECIGYPHTSPLELLKNDPASQELLKLKINGSPQPVFIGTFLTDHMRAIVKNDLGLEVVQSANPAISNNKVIFGAMAESYGFQTMPRVTLEDKKDTTRAVDLMLKALNTRAEMGEPLDGKVTLGWIKLAGGSGGDFVQKIAVDCSHGNQQIIRLDLEHELDCAYERIRKSVEDAFYRNNYGEDALQKFWPQDSYKPDLSSILVEVDAHARGEILANASNLMVVEENGSYSIKGFFKQLTGPDGDYIGSVPFSPHDEFGPYLSEELFRNLEGIVNFVHSIGVRGYIGVDFFLVKNENGDIESVMTEVNSRIPISGTAKIMADKLEAPAWINLNIQAQEPILTIQDFYNQFGNAAEFTPGDFSECRIIPQAFRTLTSEDKVIPSAGFKALVVGPDPESCLEFVRELKSRGIAK